MSASQAPHFVAISFREMNYVSRSETTAKFIVTPTTGI
jgi:hypothetical protein